VYYRYGGSNGWDFAQNISLLGSGEIHMLIPEPSVVLLWLSSIATIYAARRRRSRRAAA
jgi:hypothetical protein